MLFKAHQSLLEQNNEFVLKILLPFYGLNQCKFNKEEEIRHHYSHLIQY